MVARWSDGMVYQAGGQAMPSFGFWPTENTEVVDALKHKIILFTVVVTE